MRIFQPWRLQCCGLEPGTGRSHQQPAETGAVLPSASGGRVPLPPPWFGPIGSDFGLLASRTPREYISIVLNQVRGHLLQQPTETVSVHTEDSKGEHALHKPILPKNKRHTYQTPISCSPPPKWTVSGGFIYKPKVSRLGKGSGQRS